MIKTVAFCRPDANLAVAAASMWEHNCGLLPVVNDRGKVTSVITDRDICIAFGTRNKRACEISVRDVAYRAAVLCNADDDVRSALKIMATERVRRLPVVNHEGALVGILSLDDVTLRARHQDDTDRPPVSFEDVMKTLRAIYKHGPASQHSPGGCIKDPLDMMITAKGHSDPTIGLPRIERWLGQQLFKSIGPAPIRFVLKDGTEISSPGSSPIGTVFIHDNRTLAKLMIDPEMAFGEAYAEGRVHVNGDLVRLLEAVYQSMGAAPEGRYARLTSKWMNWWQANTLRGSHSNVHRHYDLGNDFYKLWLDPQMIYTCAYFASPQATLEEAGEA